jgi:chorismate dehydratase
MSPSASTTTQLIARIPYLNCAPFFHGMKLAEGWDWCEANPRQLGQEAKAGKIFAGPLPLADFLRQQDQLERLGVFGVAMRGRCQSTMVFSKKPVRQLDGAVVAVTDESSTTALLWRLLAEQRYGIRPAYRPGTDQEADAVLLIGDEALQFHAGNRRFPYEIDVSFEWWLWQHLPCVTAVWAVRKDADPADKQALSRELARALGLNSRRLNLLAAERAPALGRSAEDLTAYLEHFIYRFSQPEEDAIQRFSQLIHEHGLL